MTDLEIRRWRTDPGARESFREAAAMMHRLFEKRTTRMVAEIVEFENLKIRLTREYGSK